jgi:hypothetical protein
VTEGWGGSAFHGERRGIFVELSSSSCRSSPWSPCLLHPSLAAIPGPDLCVVAAFSQLSVKWSSQPSVMPDPIRHPVTRWLSREETHLPRARGSFRLTDVRRLDPGSGAGVTEGGVAPAFQGERRGIFVELSSSSCRSSPWSSCLLHPSLAAIPGPDLCVVAAFSQLSVKWSSKLSVMPDPIRHPVTRCPSRGRLNCHA